MFVFKQAQQPPRNNKAAILPLGKVEKNTANSWQEPQEREGVEISNVRALIKF